MSNKKSWKLNFNILSKSAYEIRYAQKPVSSTAIAEVIIGGTELLTGVIPQCGLAASVSWVLFLFLCYDDSIIYSSASPACVFQGKVDSVAASLQLRSQLQVSVQLRVCQTPREGNFLQCVSADRLIRGCGIALSWLSWAK